jgi:hypothetical protein
MGWGTVKVDDIAEGTVDTRFAKFVEQIVARKIVPLLGSGVSYGHAPNVGQLLERTRELIPPPFDPALATGSDFAFVCEMIYAKHGNAVLLCEALKIQELADPALPLTAAHLYIALLAYEGFIDLAITTNYDCGLDRAYRQLSKHRDGEEWLPITSAIRSKNSRNGFQLFKINGCALDYAKSLQTKNYNEIKAAAENILLADFQINQFWSRHWAKSKLDDTLRQRQLAFSGFGSDERQMWHTILRVANDVGHQPNNGSRFLWLISHGENLNRWELQALIFENRARAKSTDTSKQCFDNVIGPGLVKSNPKELDAGDFWRLVWIEALHIALQDANRLMIKEFVGGLGAAPSHRADQDRLSSFWKTIVDDVFSRPDAGWLREPLDFRNRVAPSLLTTRSDGGDMIYVSLCDYEYIWLPMMLILFSTGGDERKSTSDATFSISIIYDEKPVLSVSDGRIDLRIGGFNRASYLETFKENISLDTPVGMNVEYKSSRVQSAIHKSSIFDLGDFSRLDFSTASGIEYSRSVIWKMIVNATSSERPVGFKMYSSRSKPL